MAGQRRRSNFDLDDRAFRAGLAQAAQRIDLQTERDLLRLGYSVVKRARQYCPVDTGRLRSSIDVQKRGRDALGPYVDVGTRVDYASYVEYGTRYMNAQPYMRPALLEAARSWQVRAT